MKTKIVPNPNTAGTALLVTLFLITILAISIAGYLSYTQQQSFLGARAQSWNMALSVSEAGVEEGLEQLNNNWSHLTADGWTQDGTTYSITRPLGDGNSYTVYIDYSSTIAPIITARAFINPPRLAQINTPPVFFATAGVTVSAPTNVTRAIQVTTSRGSLFLAAMVARHKIDMNGNYILTDSFDSADPAKSTNGHYDVTKAGDRGDVASNDGIINTVSAGNADIYGTVHTGPGGTASVGSQGGVGDHTWRATHTGIEPGWFYDNANFTFPDTSLPYNTGIAPPPMDVITIAGNTTNQIAFNNVATPPSAPLPGQTLGPVTTNSSSSVSSVYPGSQPGMTTNTTWQRPRLIPAALPV